MFDPHRPVLKERLKGGFSTGVLWLALGSPAITELAGNAKPDGIVIDMQHGLYDRSGLEAAVGAAPRGVPVIVRVAENAAYPIGQALDAGAEGVLVPLVETAEEAVRAVSFAKFPPDGVRSGGGVRPLADFGAYLGAANKSLVVGVMIETLRGIGNAQAICRVPGLDFVFIGTGDLMISLAGFPDGQKRHAEACRSVFEAARLAGIPCGIFTLDTETAAMRRAEGYKVVVVANDIDMVAKGFKTANTDFRDYREGKRQLVQAVAASPGSGKNRQEGQMVLNELALGLAAGRIKIIDLTQTLRPSTPVIQLPPPFAPSAPFSTSEISKYDERGPAWYWNNIAMGEHTGTHFDAPVHWVTGKDNKSGFTDTIPVQRFVAPACVIDCSKEAAADEKFLIEPHHIEHWESKHGRIPAGSWVLMRTDWSKRTDPAKFLNMKEDGPHVPGPSAAAVRLLAEKRDVNGWGVEAVGTDAGQAFAFEPPFPAHALMHGSDKFGLASLTNLDKLPPTGALLITPPLKIENGSGSPLRVLALVAG